MQTRKGTTYFFYVIICCLLSCCHWSKQEQEILFKDRLLIEERPDSAYILLYQMHHPLEEKDSIALPKDSIAAMQFIHQSDIGQVAHQQESKIRILMILFIGIFLPLLSFGIFRFFKSRKRHPSRKKELIPFCQELKYKEVLRQIEQFKQTDVYKRLCEIDVLSNSESFKLTKAETEEIYRSTILFFSDTIQFLNLTYPALKADDIYCILLYTFELSTRTISTCMGISTDALRNRKARIKGKIDVVTFNFFFDRKQ